MAGYPGSMKDLVAGYLTKKNVLRTIGLLAVLLVAIQLVPYGWQHSNPPVIAEPNWDSPRTRELAKIACFDCHSNETVWPWYASVAPLSWLSVNHVNEGRDELNFSEWPAEETDEIVETVLDGEMPTWDYMLLHPAARLSDADTQALADGLRATLRR
jgi:mono/diheme cytochrome c family protein